MPQQCGSGDQDRPGARGEDEDGCPWPSSCAVAGKPMVWVNSRWPVRLAVVRLVIDANLSPKVAVPWASQGPRLLTSVMWAC